MSVSNSAVQIFILLSLVLFVTAYPQSQSNRVRIHVPLKVLPKQHAKRMPFSTPIVKKIPVPIVKHIPIYKTIPVPVIKQVVVPVPVYVGQYPHDGHQVEQHHVESQQVESHQLLNQHQVEPQVQQVVQQVIHQHQVEPQQVLQQHHVQEHNVPETQLVEYNQHPQYTVTQPIVKNYVLLSSNEWENTHQPHVENSYAYTQWTPKESNYDNYLNHIEWNTERSDTSHVYDYKQPQYEPSLQYYVKLHEDEPQESLFSGDHHYVTKHQLSDQFYAPNYNKWESFYKPSHMHIDTTHFVNPSGLEDSQYTASKVHGENSYTDRQVYEEEPTEFKPFYNHHAKGVQTIEKDQIERKITEGEMHFRELSGVKNTKLKPIHEMEEPTAKTPYRDINVIGQKAGVSEPNHKIYFQTKKREVESS